MKNTIRENALLLAAHMRETAEEIEYQVEQMTIYRYYTLHRPPMLGGVPIENLVGCEMYMKPVQSENGNVWGYVDYTEPLTDDIIADCELVYASKIEGQEA